MESFTGLLWRDSLFNLEDLGACAPNPRLRFYGLWQLGCLACRLGRLLDASHWDAATLKNSAGASRPCTPPKGQSPSGLPHFVSLLLSVAYILYDVFYCVFRMGVAF